MGLKNRLIAGTINWYDPEEGWNNDHLDKSDRDLWHEDGPRKPTYVADLADRIPCDDGIYDEVRCWQTLEHLKLYEAERAAAEFLRVLKPGGVLDVEVPNIGAVAKGFTRGKYKFSDLIQNIYGEQMEAMPDADLMTHRWGYDAHSLENLLDDAGFSEVKDISAKGGPIHFLAIK